MKERLPRPSLFSSVYLCPLANFVLLLLLDPAWSQIGPAWRRDWSPFFPIAPGLLALVVLDSSTGFGIVRLRIRPDLAEVVLVCLASLATAPGSAWLRPRDRYALAGALPCCDNIPRPWR
jgi:hypothetical protein